MFGSLGGPEIVFIFVLALLLFGPRKLPEIGRTVGRTLADLRRATHEFRSTLEREIDVEQSKEPRTDSRPTANALAPGARDAIPRQPARQGGEPSPDGAGPPSETAGTERAS